MNVICNEEGEAEGKETNTARGPRLEHPGRGRAGIGSGRRQRRGHAGGRQVQ